MNRLDNDRLNAAALSVMGGDIPTEATVMERLSQLNPPQDERVRRIARSLTLKGMEGVAAEKMALGVGLGILMMDAMMQEGAQ